MWNFIAQNAARNRLLKDDFPALPVRKALDVQVDDVTRFGIAPYAEPTLIPKECNAKSFPFAFSLR
jgi:hypothetical protein